MRSDPCLFVKRGDGERIYVWIHVDDTFVASSSASEISGIQELQRKEFKITLRPGQNESLHYNGIFGSVDHLSGRTSKTGDAFMMKLEIPYGALQNLEARQANKGSDWRIIRKI